MQGLNITMQRLKVTLQRLKVTLQRLKVSLQRLKVSLQRLKVILQRLKVILQGLKVILQGLHRHLAKEGTKPSTRGITMFSRRLPSITLKRLPILTNVLTSRFLLEAPSSNQKSDSRNQSF